MSAVMTLTGEDAAEAPCPEAERDRRLCIIVNTTSGKQEDDPESRLSALDARAEVRRVYNGRAIPETVDRAVADGFGTIVAAGGDGTICAVASKLVDTDLTMGVLPMGTFNYFARSLGLPEEVDDAARVLAEGRPIAVQVGEVNGQTFLNNASLGIYPAILRRRERIYRRWGRSRLAAYWSVLLALLRFRSPLRLKVTVDGQVRRLNTPLVFVANNAYQLELFELGGADCVRSGHFALIVAPDCGRLGLVVYAIRLALGLMEPQRDFELFCGREILVEDRMSRRLVARDGEREMISGPYHFRVRRDALRVIVPAGGSD